MFVPANGRLSKHAVGGAFNLLAELRNVCTDADGGPSAAARLLVQYNLPGNASACVTKSILCQDGQAVLPAAASVRSFPVRTDLSQLLPALGRAGFLD